MRRKIRDTARAWVGILLAACLCCMTGCAGEKAPADGSSADSQASGSNGTLVEDNWKTKGFPVLEKTGEESALWAAEYIAWQHEDIDYDLSGEFVVESQAWVQGERIYRLCHIYTMEWKRERTLLETFDVSSGQSSLTELGGEKLGVSNEFVEGMYVTEPGKYVFRIQNEQEQIDKIVYSDLGDQTQIVDIMAAGSEMGVQVNLEQNACAMQRDIFIPETGTIRSCTFWTGREGCSWSIRKETSRSRIPYACLRASCFFPSKT